MSSAKVALSPKAGLSQSGGSSVRAGASFRDEAPLVSAARASLLHGRRSLKPAEITIAERTPGSTHSPG